MLHFHLPNLKAQDLLQLYLAWKSVKNPRLSTASGGAMASADASKTGRIIAGNLVSHHSCLMARSSRASLKLDANAAGTGKLHLMKQSGADVIGLDWGVDMALARQELGSSTCVQGNVDPMTLFASEDCIRSAVQGCLSKAGSSRHILNVGDGVMQGTPEASVGLFCDLARQSAGSRELVGAA